MKDMKEKNNLEKFKEVYESYRKKYSLPSFQNLNQDFDIEEIACEETDFIIRKIRRKVSDKISSILRMAEFFIKPSEIPLFLIKIVKNFTQEEKEILSKIYEKVGKFEISIFELENNYSEQAEAKFIKDFSDAYQEMKPDLLEIGKIMKKNYNSGYKNSEKSYFG